MGNLTGEGGNGGLRLHFDHNLRLEFRGVKAVSRSRRTVFRMAEVAISEALFAEVLACIGSLAMIPT